MVDSFYTFSGQGFGTPQGTSIIANRIPNSNDRVSPDGTPYQIGQTWQYKPTGAVYFYNGSYGWVLIESSTGDIFQVTTSDSNVVLPSAGNINLSQGTNILTTGSGSTATIATVATPTFTNEILTSSTAHGVVIGQASSALTYTAAGPLNYVLVGQGSSADPIWAPIPDDTVVDVTGTTQTIAVGTTYISDNAGLVTFTLPATAPQGSIFAIVGNGAGGWLIAQNDNQGIKLNSSASTIGVTGSVASTNRYNCIKCMATVGGASTIWVVQNSSGTLTIA